MIAEELSKHNKKYKKSKITLAYELLQNANEKQKLANLIARILCGFLIKFIDSTEFVFSSEQIKKYREKKIHENQNIGTLKTSSTGNFCSILFLKECQ